MENFDKQSILPKQTFQLQLKNSQEWPWINSQKKFSQNNFLELKNYVKCNAINWTFVAKKLLSKITENNSNYVNMQLVSYYNKENKDNLRD